MAFKQFQTRCFSKWILCGEHTVLRGGEALVFPFKNKSLNLEMSFNDDQSLKLFFLGEHGSELELFFQGLLEKSLATVGKSHADLKGLMKLENQIPLGSGLGASAALCVAVARLFTFCGWLDESKIIPFARELENIFHGESSGVDVAVVHMEKPIRFFRHQAPVALEADWDPHWALTFSGHRGVTKECVEKVKLFRKDNLNLALDIDEKMKLATDLCKEALTSEKNHVSLQKLAAGIKMARECFDIWDLTPKMALRLDSLKVSDEKPLAVKPTGSGGGGYVLSLWNQKVDHPDLVWI